MSLGSVVASQQKQSHSPNEIPNGKESRKRGVISHELLGGHASVVMPRWTCSYTVGLTSLRESFMGERGGKDGEEQKRERERETDTIQYQEHFAANCFHLCEKALWYLAKLHH